MTKQISKDIFKDLQLGQQAQEWWWFDSETLEKVPEGLKYTHNLHKEAIISSTNRIKTRNAKTRKQAHNKTYAKAMNCVHSPWSMDLLEHSSDKQFPII